MILKSKYTAEYRLGKESRHIVLEVELRQVDGLIKPRQNAWCGVATLNGKPYDTDLDSCVDARLAATRIGKELMAKARESAKQEGLSCRLKKEEIT